MKPNGNDVLTHADPGSGPHPLGGILTDRTFSGPVLEMQVGLWELAHRHALASGATQLHADDLRILQEHAEAMAQQTWRDRYDPTANPHDAMQEAEYQRKLAQRQEAEHGEAHAIANLRDSELKLAHTPEAGLKPAVATWLVVAFVLALTVTIAPTVHDLFHVISDDLLAWFFSLGSSAAVGAMLTVGILSGRRTNWTWVSMIAGIILGIGLFFVRISAVEQLSEYPLAIGLTVAEIAIVILLEVLARSLVQREDAWQIRHTSEQEAMALRDARRADVARWKARIEELNAAIKSDHTYVESRHLANVGIEELKSVARKAVADGYSHGLSENLGRVRGVRVQ